MVEVEVERSGILVSFDNLICVLIAAAFDAFAIGGEPMSALIDLPSFAHFSIKIIKYNTNKV
jgi:hypothetical protein